jgi:hypothetical protein
MLHTDKRGEIVLGSVSSARTKDVTNDFFTNRWQLPHFDQE